MVKRSRTRDHYQKYKQVRVTAIAYNNSDRHKRSSEKLQYIFPPRFCDLQMSIFCSNLLLVSLYVVFQQNLLAALDLAFIH